MTKESAHGALSPSDATERIRAIARADYALSLTVSVRDRLRELDLYTGDIHHVLLNGEVVEPARQATCLGYHKYVIECGSPNFVGKTLRLVVIPSPKNGANGIKICEILN